MSNAESEKITSVVKAFSREEMEVFLHSVPIDMIWKELERKITELNDFKDSFDRLAEKANKGN